MPREFCEHLDHYGANWIRAEAAYGALTAAIDRVIDQGPSDDHLDLLEVAVGEWQYEVNTLRERFLALVRQGAVDLPAPAPEAPDAEESDPDQGEPVCSTCGSLLPRLTWPEWNVQGAVHPTFRGGRLPQAVPA
jgi:hypothetical protein